MRLYDINKEYNALWDGMDDFIDEETGEIDPEFANTIAGLEYEVKDEIEMMGCLLKEWNHNEKALAEEIKRLQDRKSMFKNKQAWLINYVTEIMDQLGLEKHTGPRKLFATYLQKNPDTVEVEDVTSLPEQYQRITIEAKKKDLKDALKAGEKIDGVQIIEGQRKVRFK